MLELHRCSIHITTVKQFYILAEVCKKKKVASDSFRQKVNIPINILFKFLSLYMKVAIFYIYVLYTVKSFFIDELRGLIWGIWVQLTYYYNLLVLLKENRDTWIYISFFLLSALAHFFILFWGFSFFLFLKINLFVYCQWSPVESRCIVPDSWNWVHNKWSYNNKLFKVWMHLSELQETKSRHTCIKLPRSQMRCNMLAQCA